MMIEDTSVEVDRRVYASEGIQVIYPPIGGVALRRVKNHERHAVRLELDDCHGGGSIYLIGGRYEKEEDAKSTFERADVLLRNGGIIKLLDCWSADVLPAQKPQEIH